MNEALMRWLIRLITPPGGVVLDMFCGSGSTCVAAIQEGMHFIGIEQDESYTRIANARISHAQREANLTPQTPQTPQEYECAPDCPVRIIGEQSGERKSGGPIHASTKGRNNGFLTGKPMIADRHYIGEQSTSASRYFQQFPPDSLFAELDDVEVDSLTEREREAWGNVLEVLA